MNKRIRKKRSRNELLRLIEQAEKEDKPVVMVKGVVLSMRYLTEISIHEEGCNEPKFFAGRWYYETPRGIVKLTGGPLELLKKPKDIKPDMWGRLTYCP